MRAVAYTFLGLALEGLAIILLFAAGQLSLASWLLLHAAAAAITMAVLLARRPILARMATRNALRRPRQSATVIAGLMVGTAIVSAALVAGGSAQFAIRGFVYQSLGEIDETVSIEGYPYFPEVVYDDMRRDDVLGRQFDGIAAHAIWGGAAEMDSGLFEPSVAFIGFDPAADRDFGVFELAEGSTSGAQLARGEAILTQELATVLEAEVGDRVVFRYTPPIDPYRPEFTPIDGIATLDLLPGTSFEVGGGATRITVVAAPNGTDLAPLSIALFSPDGEEVARTIGETGRTAWLNHTSAPTATLARGVWEARIASTPPGAAVTGAVVVGYPVYDLAGLRNRTAMQAEEVLSRFAPQREHSFTVAAVTTGGKGDLFDFRTALFVRLDEAQELLGREAQVNLVKFSNTGDQQQGVHDTRRAVQLLERSLEGIQDDYPVPSVQALEVQPVKQEFLEVADDAGQTLTGLLVFAGSLSILTGLLLIINIFTMLAEERRSELGMARALGMGRNDITRLFLIEGSLYAVAAAAAGAVLGLGLAWGMVGIMNALVSQLAADLSFPDIPFRPTWSQVTTGFSVGLLLTFLTIVIASRRASRLDVVTAIRNLEPPPRSTNRLGALLVGAPIAVVGILATTLAWTIAVPLRFTMQVVAPLFIAVGLMLLLRPYLDRRHLHPILATLLAAYYVTTYFVIDAYGAGAELNIVGPLRGALLTLCVVVLVTYFDWGPRVLGRLLSRSTGMRAVAIPALSYPLHKKFRTGMTLAMFSIIILSIGFFSIFGALFQTDPERHTGGFDIEATTTLDVEDLAPFDAGLVPDGTIVSEHRIEVYRTEDPDFIRVEGGRTGNFGGDFNHHVYGYDEGFVDAQRFRLLWRLPGFADDQEVYDTVLERDDLIIISYQYSTDERNQDLAYEVGDELTMQVGDDELRFTIAGIQEQYHHPGVWLSNEVVTGTFPRTSALYLFRLDPSADGQETARLLERNYKEVGLDAKSSVDEVLREQKTFRQILGAMKLFLGLGLVVGILSLGIVTSRSVLERRQEIGMLRALGYTRHQVRRIFTLEVTMTLVMGALVGLACAIVVTYGLWFALIRELQYPYVIPWAELGLLLGVSYLIALLATIAPIRRSAKVAPAEALRYVE